jgi:hypothetical protein
MLMRLTIIDPSGRGGGVHELSPGLEDRPLMVGSREDCDVRVSGPSISSRHCAIFTHGGMWLVQDLGSTAGTYVNDARIERATQLQGGDVVSLGRGVGAVMLRIDDRTSAGAGAGAGSGLDMSLAELERAAAVPEAAAPVYAPPAPELLRTYKTPQQGVDRDMRLAGVLGLVALLILGAIIIYFAVQSSRRPVVVVGPGVDPAVVAEQPPVATAPSTRPLVVTRAAPEPTPAQRAAVEQKARLEAHRHSTAWQRVEQAHRMDPPAQAILTFDAYRTAHPDSPFARELDAYVEDTLDRIWWQRVNELQQEHRRAAEKLTAMQDQLAQSEVVPLRLSEQKAQLEKTMRQHESALREMRHTSPQAVDPYDEHQLEELRRARDRAAYEQWKDRVLSSIRRTRGSLPW